jgi:hypothetical protein
VAQSTVPRTCELAVRKQRLRGVRFGGLPNNWEFQQDCRTEADQTDGFYEDAGDGGRIAVRIGLNNSWLKRLDKSDDQHSKSISIEITINASQITRANVDNAALGAFRSSVQGPWSQQYSVQNDCEHGHTQMAKPVMNMYGAVCTTLFSVALFAPFGTSLTGSFPVSLTVFECTLSPPPKVPYYLQVGKCGPKP